MQLEYSYWFFEIVLQINEYLMCCKNSLNILLLRVQNASKKFENVSIFEQSADFSVMYS